MTVQGSSEPDGRSIALAGLRMDRPTPARMYDYFLGGKDNFQVDRDAADQLDEAAGRGTTFTVAWENRRFLQRAVACLAEAGIDQFVDIGAGLPTQGNVHEIAQRVNPAARVAYVDNDPIVLSHGRALLADDKTTKVFTADMREPQAILTAPGLAGLIDFSRPVAVLFVAVLHFVRDEEDPYGIVGTFRDAMAPGSYLVLSHVTTDGLSAELLARNEEVYERSTSPSRPRSGDEIARFFDGLDLLEPGLVRPGQWRPWSGQVTVTHFMYAGVGTKTARRAMA
jgi:SAM-dependent methyltransferase